MSTCLTYCALVSEKVLPEPKGKQGWRSCNLGLGSRQQPLWGGSTIVGKGAASPLRQLGGHLGGVGGQGHRAGTGQGSLGERLTGVWAELRGREDVHTDRSSENRESREAECES